MKFYEVTPTDLTLHSLITRLKAHRKATLESTSLHADLTLAIAELQGKSERKSQAKRIDHMLSREAVINAIKTRPVTVTQISKETGLVGLTVRNHLKALKKLDQAHLHSWDCKGRAPVKIYFKGSAPDAERPCKSK